MDTPLIDQTIRYTTGQLGLIDAPELVAEGDLGRYLGPAPDDGWHYTEPAKHPGKVCPVSLGMIEAA
jgi:hypothetical protein